jgi:hypothetical protein
LAVRLVGLRENHMGVSCLKCRRVFIEPFIVLGFGSGKTRLVNVCPYCNHVLGDADAGEKERGEVRVGDLEKEVDEG